MSRWPFISARAKSLVRAALLVCLAALALSRLISQASGSGAIAGTGQQAQSPNAPEAVAVVVNSMSTPREGHTATLLQNGKVLAAGGRSDAGSVLNTAEVYDPLTGLWMPAVNSLSAPRYGHTAIQLRNGLVLIAGGRRGAAGSEILDTAELYDPATNRWTALNARMTTARARHTATLLLDGRVLFTGGENGGGLLNSTEFYNAATQTFTAAGATGNLNDARRQHTATLLGDGKVLAAGGANNSASLKSAETFDPTTGKWKRVGDLRTARHGHTATMLPTGEVLIAAGVSGGALTDTSELFSPIPATWAATNGNLATPRQAHSATLLPSGSVLVAGGTDASGAAINSAQVYNRLTKVWSAAPSFTFSEARGGHTATILHNGRVLFAGGQSNSGNFLSSSEYYEPVTASWVVTTFPPVSTATPAPTPVPGSTPPVTTQMNVARKGHTATVLPDGRVLAAGGTMTTTGGGNSILNTAEIFDPFSGRWTLVAATMNAARASHTATLLPNGKVLLIGGNGGGGNSAELFDPASQSFTPTVAPGVSRVDHTATLLPNGKVLVVGGQGATSSAQLYDPSASPTGGWSSAGAGALSPARHKHTATLALVNGVYRVFIFGGLDASNRALKSPRFYNVETNAFSTITAEPTRFRYDHTATLLPDGRVFVSGGRGGTNGADVGRVIGNSEIFNPSAGTWDANLISTASRVDHTATLLPNGRVLLIGGRTISASGAGCSEPASVSPAQIFDPLALTVFTSLQDAPLPLMIRSLHTATLLTTGQLLIAGGEEAQIQPNCNVNALRHSELYDLGLGFNENWQPILNYVSGSSSGPLTIFGTFFQGFSEAAGHGGQNSASNYPVVQLRSLENEQITFILPSAANGGWTKNTFNFQPVANFAAGLALMTVIVNGIPSESLVVTNSGSAVPILDGLFGSISGRITYHNGKGLQGVGLDLSSPCFNSDIMFREPNASPGTGNGRPANVLQQGDPPSPRSNRSIPVSGPNGEFSFTRLRVGCEYTLAPYDTENGKPINFVPEARVFTIQSGGLFFTQPGISVNTVPAVEPTPLPVPSKICTPDCSNANYATNKIDGSYLSLGGAVKVGSHPTGDPNNYLDGTIYVPYEDSGANLNCRNAGGQIPCTLGAKTTYGDTCVKLNPEIPGICSCTRLKDGSATECAETVLGRSVDSASISFNNISSTDTGFNVTVIPYGADALFIPSNKPILSSASPPPQYVYIYSPMPADPGRGTIFKELAGVNREVPNYNSGALSFLNEQITGTACSYTLATNNFNPNFPIAGGNGNATVMAAVGCNWLPTSGALNWLQILSGLDGANPINYTVAQNVGPERMATLTLVPAAQQSITVKQAGAAVAPTVATASASNITTMTATLSGAVNPNGTITQIVFEYDTNSSFTTKRTANAPALPAANTPQTTSVNIADLIPKTTYYFRIVATGALSATSDVAQFTTAPAGIAGAVRLSYGASPQPVPGVNLALGGAASQNATSNAAGAFSFGDLSGGNYGITPSKTGDIRGISNSDASRVATYVLNGTAGLSEAQRIAADANGNGTISNFDASMIAGYVLNGSSPGTVIGMWRFLPASLSFNPLADSVSGQNFEAVLIGDATGNWTPGAGFVAEREDFFASDLMTLLARVLPPTLPQLPLPDYAGDSAAAGIMVSLPNLTLPPGASVTIPITVESLTGSGVLGYEFDFLFDQNLLTPQAAVLDQEGTLTTTPPTTVLSTVSAGRVRVVAFGATPLSGSGTLLKLKFTVPANATPGATTQLRLNPFTFNEGDPASMVGNGNLTIASPVTAPTVTTNAAGNITTTAATLNGTVNPNGGATTTFFEWSASSNLDNSPNVANAQSLAAGNAAQAISANLTNLAPGTTYFFRAAANNSAGTTRGAMQNFTTTSCTFTINPTSQNFAAGGGNGTVTVTAAAGCGWAVSGLPSWITSNVSAQVIGNGAVVLNVAANNGPARNATITVAGQNFNITQDGGCAFSLGSTSQNFTAAGGTGTVALTASNTACPWTAISSAPDWLTLAVSSGTGSASVGYAVVPYAGTTPRSATLTIAGQTFTVNQAGCAFTISPTSRNFTAAGGADTINVTATGSACTWTASSNRPWITVTSGASGTGNGTVNFSVAANPDAVERTGAIAIADQTFTVTQAAAAVINRVLRAGQVTGAPGSTVSVPIELVSQGDENAIGFSLTFAPAILSNPQASLGADATSASLNTNSSQTAQGRFGVLVSLPTGQRFSAGTRQVVNVSFTLAANASAGSTPIAFGDQPIMREIADASANTLPANYVAGAVTIAQGYEADVAPRPNGNGSLTISDWVQVGRFVAGLDTPDPGSEFQRADVAPRATFGDGRLTIADWVQAGRYAAGLDLPTAAGGPTSPAATTSDPGRSAKYPGQQNIARALRITQGSSDRGALIVELDAQGNENAVAFSLGFNPAQIRFVSAALGDRAAGATLNLNTRQMAGGRLGIAIALPAGQSFAAGPSQLLTVTFVAVSGDNVNAAVSFPDQPVTPEAADINANALPIRFTSGAVRLARAVANVSAASFLGEELAAESIVAAFGGGLATGVAVADSLPLPTALLGTTVKVRDSAGAERDAPLFFVAPGQVNYQIPPCTAPGEALVTIIAGDGLASTGRIRIAPVAPGLLSANADGQGIATAVALRVKPDGAQSYEPLARFDAAAKSFVALPLDLGPTTDQVFLIVFGTGIRGRDSLGAVMARLGGLEVPVLYAGEQGAMVGLDQINLGPIPRQLAGRGEVEISLTVEGREANTIRINLR
ncbi:MAG: kelch repeat-containing protein [Acidobacteriota bacterium]